MRSGVAGIFVKLKPLAASLLICALAACAPGPSIRETNAILPEASGDMGRIYFYRAPGLFMAAVEAKIIVNSRKVGALAPGTAFFRDALPGRYELVLADDPETVLTFSVQAGALSFIEVTASLDFSGVHFSAQEIGQTQGRRDLMDLTLVDPAAPTSQ